VITIHQRYRQTDGQTDVAALFLFNFYIEQINDDDDADDDADDADDDDDDGWTDKKAVLSQR